jgi:hypothetical protein
MITGHEFFEIVLRRAEPGREFSDILRCPIPALRTRKELHTKLLIPDYLYRTFYFISLLIYNKRKAMTVLARNPRATSSYPSHLYLYIC